MSTPSSIRDDPALIRIIDTQVSILTLSSTPAEITAQLWHAAECGFLLGKVAGAREVRQIIAPEDTKASAQ